MNIENTQENRWKKNGQPNIMRNNKVARHTTWTVNLNTWEMKLIRQALTGHLTKHEDIVLAKHLGYTILDYQVGTQVGQEQHKERLSIIAQEGLEESQEEIEELLRSEEE
tara:strand:+ start:83 stop:412 length:330 start_codon:yes stop_codon:yes gene_type:complete